MRRIRRSGLFRRDYRRVLKGRYSRTLAADLRVVVELLAKDLPLEAKYCDHPLGGKWKGLRDCHIKPDLVLIYGKPDADVLRLARLGSHSELGL